MASFFQSLGFAALAVLTISSARADAGPAESDLAYSAIESGNWAGAEAQLRAELATSPEDPMRMVNLAYVLQRQGRDTEATDMYRKVLALKSNPKVAIGPDERNVKGVRVKAIASKGIASLEGQKE